MMKLGLTVIVAMSLSVACGNSKNKTGDDEAEQNISGTDNDLNIPGNFDSDAGIRVSRDGPKDGFIDDASPLFSRETVIDIRITLPEDKWQALILNAQNEQYTPADVTIMGTHFQNIGLRFRGAEGSLYSCFDDTNTLICDKLPMKLKFNEYVADQQFKGLHRLNLQSWKNDPTKIHDCMAYDILERWGLWHPGVPMPTRT